MRRLHSNPDVNELLNYNGARIRPPPPKLPLPYNPRPFPNEPDEYSFVPLVVALLVTVAGAVFLGWP